MATPVGDIEQMLQNTINLAEAGLREFGNAEGSLPMGQAVIVVGGTGVGKSALINLLAGVHLNGMYDDGTGKTYVEVDNQAPHVPMGHRVIAETGIPVRFPSKPKAPNDPAYWDCPGWEDNRGPAQEIANAVCMKRLFEMYAEVKVIFVVDDAHFMEPRGVQFSASINDLHQLFSGSVERIRSSISLFVSRAAQERTQAHVIRNITNMIETLEMSPTHRILLESLRAQPITIFKKPDVGPMDTRELRTEILDKIASMNYATEVRAHLSISPSCQVTVSNSYNIVFNNINGEINQFIEGFQACIDDFIAPYLMSERSSAQRQNTWWLYAIISQWKSTFQLDSIISKLQGLATDEYNAQNVPVMIERCNDIARSCNQQWQKRTLTEALGRVRTMTSLEEFIDPSARIPIDMINRIREAAAASRTKIENARLRIVSINAQVQAAALKSAVKLALAAMPVIAFYVQYIRPLLKRRRARPKIL